MKDVGSKIKELRKIKGLTQKELGDLLHVSFQAVSKWESGKSLPDVAMFEDISRVLGVSVNELFYEEPYLSADSVQTLQEPIVIVKTEIIEKPVYKPINPLKIIIPSLLIGVLLFFAVFAPITISNRRKEAVLVLLTAENFFSSQSNLKIQCSSPSGEMTFIRKYYFDGRVVLYFENGFERYYYQGKVYSKLDKTLPFSAEEGSEERFFEGVPEIYLFSFNEEGLKKVKKTENGVSFTFKKEFLPKLSQKFGFSEKAVYSAEISDGVLQKLMIEEGEKALSLTYSFGYSFSFSAPSFE